MGVRCADNRGITFEDVRVPASQIVGALGEGFKVAMTAFDRTRPIVAASGVGLIRRCLDESLNYSMQRKAFNIPIIENQAIQFKVAKMATDFEVGKNVTFKAAKKIEERDESGSLLSSIAKKFSSAASLEAAIEAVQIFGGAGYSSDFAVEKLLRDSKILTIGEGTSEIQNLIIARNIINLFRDNHRFDI